jgi:hypothetical protein
VPDAPPEAVAEVRPGAAGALPPAVSEEAAERQDAVAAGVQPVWAAPAPLSAAGRERPWVALPSFPAPE